MNYQLLCIKVKQLSETVGAYIHSENKKFDHSAVEIKGSHDYVSYVDKTAEKMIVDALSALLPEAGFIAEEGTSTKKGTKYNWIVDPLDGTTNFMHSIPLYCISIALQENEETVIGVVFEINLKECFYAWKNGGAWLNDNAIKVSQISTLDFSLIATGFPYYYYSKLSQYLNIFKYFMQHSSGLRRLGTAALDLVYVACGRFDAYYEYGLRPWDVAAGAFIVLEAGGKICDFKGENNYIFGKEIIAANPRLFGDVVDVVKKEMM